MLWYHLQSTTDSLIPSRKWKTSEYLVSGWNNKSITIIITITITDQQRVMLAPMTLIWIHDNLKIWCMSIEVIIFIYEHVEYVEYVEYVKYVEYVPNFQYIQYVQYVQLVQYVQYPKCPINLVIFNCPRYIMCKIRQIFQRCPICTMCLICPICLIFPISSIFPRCQMRQGKV